MSIKTLSIVTIIIFFITLGLLGALFFMSKQPPKEPERNEEPETELPLDKETEEPPAEEPQEQVINEFDETLFNASEVALPSKDQEDRAALSVFVRAFIEDYGSFSTAGGYGHIEAYYSRMTRSMREFTEKWIEENPASQKSAAFYSIQTNVANIRIDEFDKESATVFIETARIETDVPEYYNRSKKQDVEVKLVKEGGEWKIEGVYWK